MKHSQGVCRLFLPCYNNHNPPWSKLFNVVLSSYTFMNNKLPWSDVISITGHIRIVGLCLENYFTVKGVPCSQKV